MSEDARAGLLRALIDDAGLFPPARKPIEDAIADHVAARASSERWILGRFLCPLSRLEQLEDCAGDVPDVGVVFDIPEADWQAHVEVGIATVMSWSRHDDVSGIELRLPAGEVVDAARQLANSPATQTIAARGTRVFLEVPSDDEAQMTETINAIADAPAHLGLGLKLRLGGITAAAFPSDRVVAEFVKQARRHALAFKATAGLHHPFRTEDPQLGVLQHGFVNLLAATALTAVDTRAVIEEADPEKFRITTAGLFWRNHFVGHAAIHAARRLFTAFGSCSFREPIEDLSAHKILTQRATA